MYAFKYQGQLYDYVSDVMLNESHQQKAIKPIATKSLYCSSLLPIAVHIYSVPFVICSQPLVLRIDLSRQSLLQANTAISKY